MANITEVDPLDYQRIGSNNVITLRKRVMETLGAKPDDWVVLLPGKADGTIIIRRQSSLTVDYGDDNSRG